MDTQITFDLTRALAGWRSGLPELAADDWAELEAHVHDSMAELKRMGLSEEEAFWLARRRLGDVGGLASGGRVEAGDRGSGGWLAGRRTVLMLGGGLLLAGLAAGLFPRLVQPLYESHAIMELHRLPRITGREWVAETGDGSTKALSDPSFVPTQINILKSSETRRRVIEELELESRWKLTREAADLRLAKSVRIEALPGESMVRLAVRSVDPSEARELTNRWVEAFVAGRKEAESDRGGLLFQTLTHVLRSQQAEADRADQEWLDAARALGFDPRVTGDAQSGLTQRAVLPPDPDPALAADYRKKESWAHQARQSLQKIQEDMENARLANLHPLRPVTIHEPPVVASEPVWPDLRFWNLTALMCGLAGVALVLWGRVARAPRA